MQLRITNGTLARSHVPAVDARGTRHMAGHYLNIAFPPVVCSMITPRRKGTTRDVRLPAAGAVQAPAAPASPPRQTAAPVVGTPKVKTLGWTTLRSQIVQAQVLVPPSVITVTPFDVAFGQFMGTVMQSFYWPVAPPDAHALLLKSLRHTLSAYPTLCGRASEVGKLNVNDAGVLVEFGECTAKLADLLPSSSDERLHTPLDLSAFDPQDTSPLTACVAQQLPLMTVRIGTLADGGLAVIVNFQHSVADTHTIRQFMGEWGAATRAMREGATLAAPAPHEYGRAWFDKLVASAPPSPGPIDPTVGPHGSAWLHVPFSARPSAPPPSGTATTVYVSKQRLQELKALATEQLKASGSAVGFVSSNDALLARLRQAFGRLPCRGPSRPTVANVAVEFRKRLRLAGQPDARACSETVVGNAVRAAQIEERHDPTVADLGTMAAAGRATINNNNDCAIAEAVWAAQVERQHGLPFWLEYVFGKNDLFGPFPDFSISNWEYSARDLDFGSGPAHWIQGWVRFPEVGMITPALHPDFEGGVFVHMCLPDAVLADLKDLPGPI